MTSVKSPGAVHLPLVWHSPLRCLSCPVQALSGCFPFRHGCFRGHAGIDAHTPVREEVMLLRRDAFQNQLKAVMVFRPPRLSYDPAVFHAVEKHFTCIAVTLPDLRLDGKPEPPEPAAGKPDAGTVVFSFQGTVKSPPWPASRKFAGKDTQNY